MANLTCFSMHSVFSLRVTQCDVIKVGFLRLNCMQLRVLEWPECLHSGCVLGPNR